MEAEERIRKFMKPDSILIAVLAGFVIDLIFGDPEQIYHPVRLIGRLISASEKTFRGVFPKTEQGERTAGILCAAVVLAVSGTVPALILLLLYRVSFWAGLAVEAFWCWQIVACRQLERESMRVYYALKNNSILAARYELSRIVGRDTQELDRAAITRAAVETVAENTSDGVTAPLFFMMIGGAPLGFLYKSVNTMDSMIGYKNDRYRYFGTAAARTDDVLNYIPARIAGVLMVLTSSGRDFSRKNAWKIFRRDRLKHASPNSAQCESAMAGALSVRLGGSAYYFGTLVEKPTIGDDIRRIEEEDIVRANRLMMRTSVASLILFAAARFLILFLIHLA